MTLPHIQFYVGDWRKDPGIQSLSYHHRGIWFELLLIMHCSEQRGRLTLNGRPFSNASLARLLGMSEGEAKDAIDVLIASGVASRDQNGTILNRRMVREEELRQKRREAGSKGGANAQAKREQNPDIDIGTDNGLQRVREFSRGKGIKDSDADWFYWKGRGNGWTNGGKPILDWKATLLSWQRAGYLPSQRKQSQSQPYFPKKPAPKGEAYQPRPPGREVSDEDMSKIQPIVRDAVEELKAKFKMPE